MRDRLQDRAQESGISTIQPSALRGWRHIKGLGEIVYLKTIGDRKTSL